MNGQLAPRNDLGFWLLGLRDAETGNIVNNATVTWEIRTAKYPDGEVVLDGDGSYVSSSNGDYVCEVPASEELVPGTKYVRRVQAVASVGQYDAEDYFIARGRTGRTPTT